MMIRLHIPFAYLKAFLFILYMHGMMGCNLDKARVPTPQPTPSIVSQASTPAVMPITEPEKVTIVGFPGLTDKTGPTSLIQMITKLKGINSDPIIILRPHENEAIYTHAQRAYNTLVEKGMAGKPLLLVAESFGVLVAYAMTVYNTMLSDYNLNLTQGKALHITGLISVHGPWQGVFPVSGLLGRYHQLQRLGFNSLLNTCFAKFNISDYMIPKPLEALDPEGEFVAVVKRTLLKTDYPILALAGSNTSVLGSSAYNQFREVCNTSWIKRKVLSLAFRSSAESIMEAYENEGEGGLDTGSDGLIPKRSVFAKDIRINHDNFTRIQADAPHIHASFYIYPKLIKAVSEFIQTRILDQPDLLTNRAFIAESGVVEFEDHTDAAGKLIPVPKFEMVQQTSCF